MESTLLCRWIFRILAYKFSTMCQRKPILLCLYKCVCLCERPRFFTAKNQVVKSIKVRSSPRCHSRSIAVIIFKSKQGRNSSIKTLICMNHFERKKNTKKVYAYDCVCRYTYLRHKMASARRKIWNAVLTLPAAFAWVIYSAPSPGRQPSHGVFFFFHSISTASLLACAFQLLSDLPHTRIVLLACVCAFVTIDGGKRRVRFHGFSQDICSWSPRKTSKINTVCNVGVPLGQLNMQTATNTCAQEPSRTLELRSKSSTTGSVRKQGGLISQVGVDASMQQRVGFRIGGV